MMARAFHLESFDATRRGPAQAANAPGPDLEEERLTAFEKGYGAGWEDAAAAHAKEQERIGADLARSLQDLSFTHAEAHSALMSEVEEVLRGVVDAVLPPTLRPALGVLIRDRALEIARGATTRIEIVVAPENVERVSALVGTDLSPTPVVKAEPSLGEGQAYLRFGESEEKIDLDAALSEIAQAIERFFAGESPTPRADAAEVPEAVEMETRYAG